MNNNLKQILIILLIVFPVYCLGQDSNLKINSQYNTIKKVLNRRTGIVNNLCVFISESTREYSKSVREIIDSTNELNQYMITESSLDSASISGLYQKNIDLTQKLVRLMVLLEEKPKIKKNEEFIALTAQLTGCENRITVECMKYNDTCKEQNRTELIFGNKSDSQIPKVEF